MRSNGSYPIYKTVAEWNGLNDNELRKEIEENILGFGMEGSTRFYSFISEYYDRIESNELRQRVNKILFELIDDIESGVGERVIYIISNLRFKGIKDKLLEIIKKSDYLFDKIERAPSFEAKDWSHYISYVTELNNALGRLKIVEAKDFLLKQLDPLKKPAPPPLTKEYYLYYMSAQSALKALKEISPELAEEYKIK